MTEKVDIKIIQDFANNKGGKLLSETYNNRNSKLQFECKSGHVFERTWHCMSLGKVYCKACDDSWRNRITLTQARQLAVKHNAKLLSQECTNRTRHQDKSRRRAQPSANQSQAETI